MLVKWEVPAHVHWTNTSDGVTLLDVNAGKYYALNKVGSKLWLLLSEQVDLEKMQQTLCTDYGLDASTAKADLDRFLESLEKRTLIACSKTASTPDGISDS